MKRKGKKCMMAALTVLLLLLPAVVKTNYALILIDQSLINIICVLGLNYITGLTGQTNLGMGAIFGLGAYTSALLSVRCNLNPFFCIPAVILMGLLIGQSLGRPSLRVNGIFLALTTISFGEIVRLLLTNMQGLTYGTLGVSRIPPYSVAGIRFSTPRSFYYLALIFTAVSIVLCNRIVHSRWGRELKAIRDNDESVEACGINMARIKVTAFTLCSVFGCIAGALYAHLICYIHPTDFDSDLSIRFLMMLMLGGIGSVPGIIIGAVIVTILPELLRFMENYYMLVFSVILLIFAIFRPYGLISIVLEARKKLFSTDKKTRRRETEA